MKQNIKGVSFIALAYVSALMTGCATIGESEFKCKGYPTGLPCTSVQDVYKLTDGDDYREKIAEVSLANNDETENAENVKVDVQPAQTKKEDGFNYSNIVPQHSQAVLPLRTPAKVMRIQIRPWESEELTLIVPGYHYTEIEPRRWMIGNKNIKHSNRLFSIDQAKNTALKRADKPKKKRRKKKEGSH